MVGVLVGVLVVVVVVSVVLGTMPPFGTVAEGVVGQTNTRAMHSRHNHHRRRQKGHHHHAGRRREIPRFPESCRFRRPRRRPLCCSLLPGVSRKLTTRCHVRSRDLHGCCCSPRKWRRWEWPPRAQRSASRRLASSAKKTARTACARSCRGGPSTLWHDALSLRCVVLLLLPHQNAFCADGMPQFEFVRVFPCLRFARGCFIFRVCPGLTAHMASCSRARRASCSSFRRCGGGCAKSKGSTSGRTWEWSGFKDTTRTWCVRVVLAMQQRCMRLVCRARAIFTDVVVCFASILHECTSARVGIDPVSRVRRIPLPHSRARSNQVILDKSGQEQERIDLSTYTYETMDSLLQQKGFARKQ